MGGLQLSNVIIETKHISLSCYSKTYSAPST